ncbi:hypothetical protein MMAD_06560 [Mycolicibacterium madagascariense]|uniref:Uncharacterized protein n=1 Tax=Mycolicibacterium madagascariense TaxID=212765 RepID=A0A7I7XCL2_9MYCO|nr:hypothetical protein [Mycolicibacterium madagascariense]MCV7011787.1 hypothetical protein [Mycolicibacterium madagascariense]BBZ26361.1 hypothetical protein MMAD_06560 [Mycolicibacterium madagascariense]
MAVFLRKMLGIGQLPDDMRAQVEAEGVLLLAEFVPVTYRFSGHVPGKVAKGNLASYVGALALTRQRVLATLSSVPKKAARSADHRWDAPEGTMVDATLDESGLLLDVPDMSAVDPNFSGSVSLHYKAALSAEVLAALPQRTFAFDVPPKFVYSVCGVPVR